MYNWHLGMPRDRDKQAMALLDFTGDLKELNRLLERIATALEYGVGLKPLPRPETVRKVGLDDVSRVSNATTAAREIQEEMERQNPGRGGIPVEE